jgi:hypothetical protein
MLIIFNLRIRHSFKINEKFEQLSDKQQSTFIFNKHDNTMEADTESPKDLYQDWHKLEAKSPTTRMLPSQLPVLSK